MSDLNHIPEYFAKKGMTEALAESHPMLLVRQMANETLQSALRVIVESLTREDPPHQLSIGYALGTARRALNEVSND